MASDQPTVVIYPPSGDGGRRVRAGPHFLGMAYTLLDVVEFLRLHGMDVEATKARLGRPQAH